MTVEKDGINTVYTLDYDNSLLNAELTNLNARGSRVTVAVTGKTYDINGGVDTSSLTMKDSFDATISNSNRVNIYVSPLPNYSTSPGSVYVNFYTESLDFNFTNSVDITLTSTSIIDSSSTNYAVPLYVYYDSVNYFTISPSYSVLRELSNGYYAIEVHYLFEHKATDDPLVISRIRSSTCVYFEQEGLTVNSYNRYRITVNNIQITELANQSVQDYYSAIQVGNDDMKQFFGTINSIDSSKLNHQTSVNEQFSSTVGEYTSTSTELPDFNLGSDFYSPSLDIESDSGATSDLWDLFFGSWSEGYSSSFNFFFKRVLSVITVVAVISLVISGIPNILRFRGD